MRIILLSILLIFPLLVNAAETQRDIIAVHGSAEKVFAPDKVEIIVALEGRGETLDVAKTQHDKLLNSVHRIAGKFGIAKDRVKTLSNSVMPRYEYRKPENRRVIASYSALHRVGITLVQLDKIGDLVNALTAAGIDQIQNMSFGLVENKAAKREVMLMAVKDAKANARAIAETLGVKLRSVHRIDIHESGIQQPIPMPRMMGMAAMAEGAPAAEVPSGDVLIQQNVSAQFEITN